MSAFIWVAAIFFGCLAYLAAATCIGAIAYRCSIARSTGRQSYSLMSQHESASWFAFLCGAFWPIGWAPVLASKLTRVGEAPLSRRQQRTINFERESAKIAADALKTQQEWQRLLDEEAKS